MVSRTGFTGDLGYELWMEPQDAERVWDALMEAGRTRAMRPVGSRALNMARIEAGFLLPNVDFVSAAHTFTSARERSPLELGLGWLVDFEKGHFTGRRALLAERRARTAAAARRARHRGHQAGAQCAAVQRACAAAGDRQRDLGDLVAHLQAQPGAGDGGCAASSASADALGGDLPQPRAGLGAAHGARRGWSSDPSSRPSAAAPRRRGISEHEAPRDDRHPAKPHASGRGSTPTATPQIVIEGVTKSYGGFTAVDNVSLNIYKGEMFALVGCLRLRQDDAAAHAGRLRRPEQRPHPHRWRGDERRAAASSGP